MSLPWLFRPVIVVILPAICAPHLRADEDPAIRGKKVSEWFKFLRDEPDARRRQAALYLIDSQAGPKVALVLPGLTKELREHPDPAIRAKIVELLPKYRDKGDDVITAIKSALTGDKEGAVRAAAALALGKLGTTGFVAIRELGEALKDKHPGTRAAAAEAIGMLSRIESQVAKETIPALAECLKDSDASIRYYAANALGRMGPAAVPALQALAGALAQEKELSVRKELIKTLAAMGPKASEAAEVLIKALQDANPEVRQLAALALGKVAPDASLVLSELLKATKDKDRSVRCHAIHAVGSLGKAATSAIPDLIDILKKDDVADVRLAVIEELAGFGPDAKAAVDVLTVASRDGRPAIREAAQEALKKIQKSP